jgi:dCMP deaminase
MKPEYYMRLALEVSRGSKCQRDSVGCVLVKDGRIISTGTNFHPRRCLNDKVCLRNRMGAESNMTVESGYCIHAEMNAIIFSSYEDRKGCDAYVTRYPCPVCIRLLIQSGIKRLFYMGSPHIPSVSLIRDLKPDLERILVNL